MDEDLPKAEHTKMDSRKSLAREFFEITHAELIPFVSDAATWQDFDYLDSEELTKIIRAHYGLVLENVQLMQPFWQLLDYLDRNRTLPNGYGSPRST